MSNPKAHTMKQETVFLLCLICLFAGFVGGVFFGAYKFRSNTPVAAGNPEAAVPNPALEQAKAEALKHPERFQTWVHLGNLYFDAGQPGDAIPAYEKALDIDPNNANTLTDLGVMYRRAEKPEKALECFNRAIAVDPRHEPSRFNKGIVLLHDLNQREAAIAAWQELLKVNPLAKAANGVSVDEMIRRFQSQ